jgi:hypothetical protein
MIPGGSLSQNTSKHLGVILFNRSLLRKTPRDQWMGRSRQRCHAQIAARDELFGISGQLKYNSLARGLETKTPRDQNLSGIPTG